jgi:hypothetical protein
VLRRVALVTCKELPDLDEDTRRLIAPLAARGMAATPAVWDDPEVDWKYFDLVVVRSCWDYVCRRHEFLEWVARVPYLANPAKRSRIHLFIASATICTTARSWI